MRAIDELISTVAATAPIPPELDAIDLLDDPDEPDADDASDDLAEGGGPRPVRDPGENTGAIETLKDSPKRPLPPMRGLQERQENMDKQRHINQNERGGENAIMGTPAGWQAKISPQGRILGLRPIMSLVGHSV